jgi:hypothetical protein
MRRAAFASSDNAELPADAYEQLGDQALAGAAVSLAAPLARPAPKNSL